MQFKMTLFQLQLWQILLLMCLGGLLQTDVCGGQHSVEIQEGPLYRVKGFPTSISCNVSGVRNSREQAFAFLVYKPEKPAALQIISTNEQNYAYAVYSARVREKNILIERLSPTSVLFHIKSLKADDSGLYECYTPNTDTVYHGTYNAKTTLTVIEDTLVASYSGPASHSISEGDFLQLDCQVSSQTFQHTHLSVTWYLRKSTDSQPIITLDRYLTVRPGAEFEDRYRSGLIAMEKIEDTTYRLKMSKVQHSDSGEIYCQADEWVQDPDRSWFSISHRTTTSTNIEVTALDTAHEVGSFVTQILVQNGDLEEGGMMEIQCSIEAQNLPGHFFSMTWLRNNAKVAEIGPSGVQHVDNTYIKRQNEGELRAVKKGDRMFILTIQPVRAEDQGMYQCRAVQEEKTESGSFIKGKSQLSREATVHIEVKDSVLAVAMTKQLVHVTEGETLQISCSVSGAKGLLSVSWQHRKTPGSSFSDVITLSREGVMGGGGAQYQHRGLRTFRTNDTDFILELSGALLSDSGEYMCTVSDWSMESNGNLKKVNVQSQQGQVSVQSIDSLVKVSLKSRDINILENSVMKMICSVKAPKVALAVTWKFEAFNSTVQKNIICMDHTGGMSCGAQQQDYQLETQVRESATEFILKVLRASKRQEGSYKCEIEAYDKNVQKTRKLSNLLAVSVRRPVSKLSVSTTLKSPLKIQANTDKVIDCLVTSATTNSSRFEVTWMHGTQTLLKMEPEGVITEEMDERILMRRTNRQTFQLMIRQVKSTDSGHYYCRVKEWIQDPDGIWYSLDLKSVNMELVVVETETVFSLDKSDVQLEAREGEHVKLKCSLGPGGLDPTFRYSLSWFFQDQRLSTVKLLTYSHDGRLQFQESDSELQYKLSFSRPTISVFQLTILNSIPSDSGSYYCQVDQYQADCKSNWERKASDKSGFTNVTVHFIETVFSLDKSDVQLEAREGEHVKLKCSLGPGGLDATFRYSLSWFFQDQRLSTVKLLTYSHDGLLQFQETDPELQQRLHFSRPTISVFQLTILNSIPSDSGSYYCQVDQYQADRKSNWEMKASDKSGFTNVTVHFIENRLQVHKADHFLNISDIKTGFKVECKISSRSSNKSVFEVTWSRQERDEQPRIIFTASRDGTLHTAKLDRTLVYDRPDATHYRLIVPNVDRSDNGRYQCQVVEWLQTAANTWRKVAEDKSGELSVHVHVHGLAAESEACPSGIILGSLIPLLCLLLVIVIILLIRIQKTSSGSKKQKDTLWIENTPLKAVPETATGKE